MAFSVDLGPQLESAVNDLVEKGRYGSKSEVLREGVRLVEEREAKLAALHAAIDAGLADADAGRTMPAEEAFHAVEAELELLLARPAGFAEENALHHASPQRPQSHRPLGCGGSA